MSNRLRLSQESPRLRQRRPKSISKSGLRNAVGAALAFVLGAAVTVALVYLVYALLAAFSSSSSLYK